MNVLIVGDDARAHAFADAFSKSPFLKKLYCTDGNAGIDALAERPDALASDFAGIVKSCTSKVIDLVFISAEGPIAAGLADLLEAANIPVCAPSQAGGRLEWDKLYGCSFASRHNIPVPLFGATNEAANVRLVADCMRLGWEGEACAPNGVFFKANGLCAGKGVFPGRTDAEIDRAFDELVTKYRFGDQTYPVVMQEAIIGREVSYFALVSESGVIVPFGFACDYKDAGEGDETKTGGMGAYSSNDILTPEIEEQILSRIVVPSIQGAQKDKIPTKGFWFFGIMLTEKGPMLLEYNRRFGDPEAQVILPRIQDDVLMLCAAAATNKLLPTPLRIDPDPAVGVVLAGPDYPNENGREAGIISGFAAASQRSRVKAYHARTLWAPHRGNDAITGGSARFSTIVARGKNLREASDRAYEAVGDISAENGIKFRKGIGIRT